MIFRNLFTPFFTLLLALTSVPLAVGQHAMPQGTTMVVCTDLGAQTVTLDAKGNPVQPAHSCIDCNAAPVAQALAPALQLTLPPLVVLGHLSPVDIITSTGSTPPPTHARGPPLDDVI
jgi:hypothetical protein